MKRSLLTFLLMSLCLGAIITLPTSAQEESIVLDPDTGNYIIHFRSTFPSHEMHRAVFVPATKIDPVVKSKLNHASEQNVRYSYKVKNGLKSKQPLIGMQFITSKVAKLSQIAPKDWEANVVPTFVDSRTRVNWGYREIKEDTSAGLQPGKLQNGFSVESTDLPGVDYVHFYGASPVFAVPDEGPAPDTEVGKQLNWLTTNDFVPRPAAIPRIPNPTPFDAVTVLSGIQKHVKEDLVEMKLVEPGFALKLDQGLAASIEAARRGNTEALRSEIKKLRHLLKGFGEPEEDEQAARKDNEDENGPPEDQINTKAWPHPIAKLAARVLEFDLRYVERRVKGVLE